MSTISSPRLSIASAHSPTPSSSRRPSTESTNFGVSNTSASTARTASPNVAQRRNRAALRDYYNLRPSRADPLASQPRSRSVPPSPDKIPRSAQKIGNSELDSQEFDPAAYVSHLLATSSLVTILRAENSLVSDIRTLDGERKALVYDNYSKLIKAVETIGKMRAILEEEGTPVIMTKTLAPAVGFVAETASALIREQEETERTARQQVQNETDMENDLRAEKATVNWVLDTPRRLRQLLNNGKSIDAKSDWEEVERLLVKWGRAKGVEELRGRCQAVMGITE